MSCSSKCYQIAILVSAIFLMCWQSGQSQRKLDSLLQVLKGDLQTKDKILTHNRVARIYINQDTSLALAQRDIMDSVATVHNDTLGKFLVEALNNIHYFKISDFKSSERALKRQIALATMLGNQNFITGINYELSLVKRAQNQLDSAVFYAARCYELIKANPKVPTMNRVLTLNHLGQLSEQQYSYTEALRYYFEADSIAIGVENYQVANYSGDVKLSIGSVYLKLKDTLNAKRYYKDGVAKYKVLENYTGQSRGHQKLGELYFKEGRDSSLYYLEESLSYAEKVGSDLLIASSSNLLGDYWLKREEQHKALELYNKAYTIYSNKNRESSLVNTGMRIAKLEEKKGNNRRALALVERAEEYYITTENLNGKYAVEYSKAILLEKLGRHKEGLTSLLLAHDLKDSLSNAIYDSDIKDLKIKYESSIKDKEIQDQKFQLEKAATKRTRLIMLMSVAGLFGLLLFLFMRKRMAYSKNIAAQNELIQDQKIAQLEKEKKILGMNAMIEGQEAERTRIAKDLHDGLGGLLSTVKAHFSNIQSEIQKVEKLNVYNRAHEMMDEACDEVRRISHNLMPGALRLEGLGEAVKHLGEEVETAHSFSVNVEVIGYEERMEESKEVFLYRIVQEAINNIIKHAEAKHILIQLSETKTEYHIIIEDDGKGFDPLEIQSGLGLRSIQSRVDFLKGTLDIDTKYGVGTSLTIHVPKG